MEYKMLFEIHSNLTTVLNQIAEILSIKIDQEVLDKIQNDALIDQINQKKYQIYTNSGLFNKMYITGFVDEYEPETIWIEFSGVSKFEIDQIEELNQ